MPCAVVCNLIINNNYLTNNDLSINYNYKATVILINNIKHLQTVNSRIITKIHNVKTQNFQKCSKMSKIGHGHTYITLSFVFLEDMCVFVISVTNQEWKISISHYKNKNDKKCF